MQSPFPEIEILQAGYHRLADGTLNWIRPVNLWCYNYTQLFKKAMKNTKHKRIPNSLRKHRKARGLLQKEVARILRIKNASMISRWENGLCVPKPENMFRLGVLYRVMVDALFIDFRKSFEKDILRAEQEVLQNKPEDQNGP